MGTDKKDGGTAPKKRKPYIERPSTRAKKKAILDALRSTLGVVTPALNIVGVTRKTHLEWMSKDPVYSAAVYEISEVALDFVESQHFKNIKNGDVASTIFHLKTKGRHRGYSEHLILANDQEAPFGSPALAALSVSALEKLLSQLVDGGNETI